MSSEEQAVIMVPDDSSLDAEIPENAQVMRVPREMFDRINGFLSDPASGVRRERPQRDK